MDEHYTAKLGEIIMMSQTAPSIRGELWLLLEPCKFVMARSSYSAHTLSLETDLYLGEKGITCVVDDNGDATITINYGDWPRYDKTLTIRSADDNPNGFGSTVFTFEEDQVSIRTKQYDGDNVEYVIRVQS